MQEYSLDVQGKGCPYALLAVIAKIKQLKQKNAWNTGDRLIVLVDHPPAATENIPRKMKTEGYSYTPVLLEPGLWELTIINNN